MKGAGTYNGARDEGVFHIVKFLAHTSAIIQKYGWISKNKAYESGEKSTASRVLDNLNDSFLEIDAIDLAKAKSATEWAESISDEDAEVSDYLHNIRAIARSGMVGYRTCGFAASIISAYERTLQVKPIYQVSNYVGTVKSRDTFEVVLKRHFTYDSDYGVVHKFLFNDKSGNVIIWSTNTLQNFELNKKYGVKGTVKEHSEYKGVKQTLITRCEIVTFY
jgi:hypothetical protein